MAMSAAASLCGCLSPCPEVEAPRAIVDMPYRLGSGDRLRVIVFGQDNLTNSYSVDSAGFVSMPLIGRVRAQGLSTSMLERAVEARLRQGFLREPSVSVEVEAFRPFFVLGEVNIAGQYPFINGMTVQKAIAVAGGFTARAFECQVDVTRIVDGRTVTFSAPSSFPVWPGDTIKAEERFF
jgi:polysaccharide export outer membrane protein